MGKTIYASEAEERAARLKHRADRLMKMLVDPTTPVVIVEKERVLLFDAACDLIRVRGVEEQNAITQGDGAEV